MTEEDGEEAAGGGGFHGKDDGEQTAVIFHQPCPLFMLEVVFFFGFCFFCFGEFSFVYAEICINFQSFVIFCFCFDESSFGVLNVYAKRNFYDLRDSVFDLFML